MNKTDTSLPGSSQITKKRGTSQSAAARPHPLTWAFAILVALVAFFTHLYRLGDLWPVPYFDPAYNGLDVLRIIRRGVTPIFFPTNGGREPLFLYLQALAIQGLGINSFALRLPGALAGALTIPLLFGFARTLIGNQDGPLPRWVPAWASLGLALSVWSVSQTRQGLRASLLPLISVGVFWLFVLGWRKASLLHLAGSGALLGLSAYTYTAARFLPFVLIIVVLPDLLTKPHAKEPSRPQRWLGFGVLTLVSVFVFAPLGWYYASHPAMFDARAASVMIWNVLEPNSDSSVLKELTLSLWRTLFWFVRWSVFLSAGLGVGLGYALSRIRQFEYRLLPIWWLIMLLPAVLTIGTPDLLRSLGAAPPSHLLIALGLGAIAAWLFRRWPVSTDVVLVSGLLVITLASLPTLWRYFHPDTPDPRAGTEALADILIDRAHTEVIYLPLSAYAEPSLRFLLADEFKRRADWTADPSPDPVRLIQPVDTPGSPALVRLAPDGNITLLPPLHPDGRKIIPKAAFSDQPITDRYGNSVANESLLPASADPARHLIQADNPTSMWRPGERVADTRLLWIDPNAPPGRYWLAVTYYDYVTDSRLPVSGSTTPDTIYLGPFKVPLPPLAQAPNDVQTQSARFGDVVQLLGYKLTGQATQFTLTLYWQAKTPDRVDYTVFVHVLDETGQLVTGQDNQPVNGNYPTGIWEPGEIVADQYTFDTSDIPLGEYQIEIGMYVLETGERLPVYMPDGTEEPARRLILATPVEVR